MDSRLKNILAIMTEKEQALLHSVLVRAKEGGDNLTEFSIIHNSLKINVDNLHAMKELAGPITAPPLLKEYDAKEKILLSHNYLPLSEPLSSVLQNRESKRVYSGEELTLQELSTLLHFSYGVRGYMSAYNMDQFPLRMAPSSGGLQGIELYLVVNRVEGIKKGLYHYNPFDNNIELLEEGNFRRKIVNVCTTYEFVNDASVVLILSCVISRVLSKYKIRSYRFIHEDVGFVGENFYLVGTALGLGVCAIAGFIDDKADELLRINGKDEFVSLVMTVGTILDK